ncbi:zinc-binding alcohol dehydrogenase family protein [Rhodopirellula sp. MGV]|uniref:zinc-binding alcohol dehydrogenase family protein n=1 Tax=Rhodopirellula sp. MGV TaxID=2023130 RepID=UPI000B95E554|nr:zinc-binding alcohol dehydrogenase family protein [Rhodopirellula sp. MGV]OYP35826.1 L-iditol 2-dehydrogenase [Rhodopirellula sp. MGV]PNY36361.1 L-iditol 2-dehydrogenase [Rhodopirellula baltica]
MRAIQISEVRTLKPIEIDAPEQPGPGQALVRTHRMGVCGTDISCYLGKFPFFDFPRIPGHELGVEVLAVGEGVSNVAAGDACSVEPYMNCGTCYPCRRGATNCCQNLKVIGVMCDGGLCESFLVRADKLHPAKQLSYDQLALVETLAIGCHANDRANPRPADHALIIGMGPIGLATLEFAKFTGAKVSVMDMNPERLDFVRRNYGIENTIQFVGDGSEENRMRQLTDSDFYQTIVDATGNRHSMGHALSYLAPTGTLVYVGITTDEISFRHPAMHKPEASILSSRNALPSDFTRIIGLIEQGLINTDPWITHRSDMDSILTDFDSYTKPETGVIKAVITV